MKIIINTNIPLLYINIWNGYGEAVVEDKHFSLKPRPYTCTPHTNEKVMEDEETLGFELPQGLYSVRCSLPYHNWDNNSPEVFLLPIVMDKTIALRDGKDETLNVHVKID